MASYDWSLNSALGAAKEGNEQNGNFSGTSLCSEWHNGSGSVSLQVHFLKEGCGDDNVCNSNLKLGYKFCTREGNQDKFSYLPM